MFGKGWVAALLAGFAVTAIAAGPGAVRKQAEASMLVTGNVLIEPDGSVSGWEIDQKEKLPGYVVGLVEGSASAWRFEPVVVDGTARKARARMSLRLVANQREDGAYSISIRSGYFGEEAMAATGGGDRASSDSIRKHKMRAPSYPMRAAQAGAQGTVYLVLRINRQGAVDEVVAEQVNLKFIATTGEMNQIRNVFALSATGAARKWTFHVPTTGEDADREYWSVRVPVDYHFGVERQAGYGQWDAYVPGPRNPIPWIRDDADPNVSPDAMVAGGIYLVGKGLRRKLPLIPHISEVELSGIFPARRFHEEVQVQRVPDRLDPQAG